MYTPDPGRTPPTQQLDELLLTLTPVGVVCREQGVDRNECVLTEQRLDDHSVGLGVSVRLPLGAETAHPHLVCVQVGHPQIHCRRGGDIHGALTRC